MFDNKLKEELASVKQQLAHAKEESSKNLRLAYQYRDCQQRSEEKAQVEEKAKLEIAEALRDSERKRETLHKVYAQMSGDSAFVRLGKKSYLIQSIYSYARNEEGKVQEINDKPCDFMAPLDAEALDCLVSAFHNRRKASK